MDSSAPHVVDPRIGALVVNRYRLDERLAAGGMGVVYRGERVDDGTPVAVKFLHEAFAGLPDLVKRFQREVAAMERLAHPNLIDIIDSGVSAGVPFLVMKFHLGKPLGEVLELGAMAPARAVGIALQMLSGVAHAHASGVVHRDLKPDNVLLFVEDGEERVKILDFGLAQMVSDDSMSKLTNTGFALGTPSYMSPEQAKGTPTDERTDLYAVGVVLYQMLVGRKPFVADSPMAVLRMHMEDSPIAPAKAAPTRISARLNAAILRVLDKSPARRWPSAVKFAVALKSTPEGLAYASSSKKVASKLTFGMPVVQHSSATQTVRRALRFLLSLSLVGILVAGAWAGWSRLRRRDRQQVKQTLNQAVGVAEHAWRSLTPPKPIPPSPAVPPEEDGDESDPQRHVKTPGAELEVTSAAPERRAATPPRRPPRIEDAARLLAAERVDDAIQLLYQLRRQVPHSPAIALLLGHAYFRKLWRSDGLREYDSALQLRPSLRHDRPLVHNIVAALDDPTAKLARTILRRRVGTAALPELRRAAHNSENSRVQARASQLASDLSHHAKHR